MSIELIVILMFGSMLGFLLTGRQIFAIIGGVGTIATLALWGTGGSNMPFFSAYMFMKWFTILSIPPFIFMGILLARSGIAEKLFQALYLWIGGIKGGLAVADVGLSCLVAAMSGTNIASEVTSTSISLPAMLKRKYDKTIVIGTVLAGGGLGFLIPPSVVLILYGVIAQVSIGHLWVAAILPGLLLAVLFVTYILTRCRLQPHLGPALPPEDQVGWGEKFKALGAGIAPIVLIFVVLGLLFMGVTSLIECSTVGAIGAIVCTAINRRLSWKLISEVLDQTLHVSVMMMWIFAAALLFSAVFDGLGAIHAVENLLGMAGGGRWGTLIMMQLSFFLMGMVMDDTAMLLIVAPLYVPLVVKMGFSPVWFGVLYVLNCQMAFITPPFGYNLFIMKSLIPTVAPDSGITIVDIYRSAIPFVIIQIICLALVMLFPQIALYLPSLFFQAGA
ncbi:TRAP transporter large permease subunit [Chloroflexota bacterium]